MFKVIKIISYLILIIAIIAFTAIILLSIKPSFSYKEKCLEFLLDKSAEFYATAVAVISTFLSVGLPVSVSVISEHLKQYNSVRISRLFTNEVTFRLMLYQLISVFIITAFLVFGIKSVVAIYITLALTIFFLVSFYYFINRVVEYSISTDSIIEESTDAEIEDYIHG